MANSRYPNMSYCMMNNTDLALQQVLEHMVEALQNGQEGAREFLNDLSSEERRAFNTLYSACQDFVKMADEMEFAREDA